MVVTGAAVLLGDMYITALGKFSSDSSYGFGMVGVIVIIAGGIAVVHSD